jgi:hypothetical protein
MLGGVGGKFVQRQCNPLRHVRKEAKARQDLLAREVDHRARNAPP